MCGISGVVTREHNKLTQIKAMVTALEDRGPDGAGIYITEKSRKNGRGYYGNTVHDLAIDLAHFEFDPGVEFAFGHNRLSIIDLENRSRQPMHYDAEKYTIIFNGEIFNYIELKNELILKGHEFKTESDTEVIMSLYKE